VHPAQSLRGEHFVHCSTRVIGRLVVDVEIALDRLEMTDPFHASDLTFDLLGDFLSPLRHWDLVPFARARFVRRSLEERRGRAPLAREGDGLTHLRFGEFDVVRRAILFYLFFDELLFFFKHKRSNPVDGLGIISF
jgi:hypothetical protein